MTIRYAILGSGAIGGSIARRSVAAGVSVSIANNRGPESLADLVAELGPLAEAVTAADALSAEIVILALPFDAVPEAVRGIAWGDRIVVDATNAIDFPAFTPRDLDGRLSTDIVADAVPGARVVKAFNTLAAELLGQDPRAEGRRRVLFLSGNDEAARQSVAALIEKLGFSPVDLGTLPDGHAQQFGGGLAARNFVQID